jgi:hypothetical protein
MDYEVVYIMLYVLISRGCITRHRLVTSAKVCHSMSVSKFLDVEETLSVLNFTKGFLER